MSDQGKWWKLWCSAMRDDELENLSVHEWFGWARFGVHMKENGKDGKIRLRSPATAVVNLLRVTTFKDAVDMIKRFPNYIVETSIPVTVLEEITVSVKCKNWNKYQGDWSRDRVRKFRKAVTANVTIDSTTNVTAQEEKRSRREEKRREDIPPKPPKGQFEKPDPRTVTAYARSIGFRLDGETFCSHYESNGWRVGKNPMRSWQAAVVTWKKNAPITSLLPLTPAFIAADPKPEDCVGAAEFNKLLGTLANGAKEIPR